MPELSVVPEPTGPEAPPPVPEMVQPPAATERPAWLPEGIDSPEALAAAYEEMKAGQKQPEQPEVQPDEAVSTFVQDAGLDPAVLSREIATNGDINAEAKARLGERLTKAGLAPAMIDEYISGQKAVLDAGVRDIMSIAGGEEGYTAMAAWASENLTSAEMESFNQIMTSSSTSTNTAKLTVGNMYARYRANVPTPGRRVRGGTGAAGGDIFHSFEQLVQMQKDPRYSADPAFREEVERKIERTHNAGGFKIKTR